MPRKYATNEDRQRARKEVNKRKQQKRKQKRKMDPSFRPIRGKYFRWVVPALGKDEGHVRILAGGALERVKKELYLEHYCIATEVHPTSGEYHLDIFISYSQAMKRTPIYYDRLVNKHGNLSRYRSLNEGILKYGQKEDLGALTNFPKDLGTILKSKALETDVYSFLYDRMIEDPFHFDVMAYVDANNLSKSLSRTTWNKAITLLGLQQEAVCNRLLRSKPGFKFITRETIEHHLNPEELTIFDSWEGYQTIVDHLNQICTWRHKRPMKTSNLLISGEPNCGKTSLFMNPYHAEHMSPIEDFVPVYKMGVKGWFPQYTSDTYGMILWNEAKLTAYPYDTVLELLEGSAMSLPTKGGFRRKVDNPLVVMTSNMTLEKMIQEKFAYNRDFKALAKANLSVRIKEVIVPKGLNLFLLQKLLFAA